MFAIRSISAFLSVFLLVSVASAQKAEVTISLNEPFFDALLDSVFQNYSILRNFQLLRPAATMKRPIQLFRFLAFAGLHR